ncbi:uncharacterized protein LOC118645805 [Monomorium pharaonis]|uniref:uncharacterized protein LOC118645805 n=1 Tax=Monomorium pharaonis TaxID=307658 RepID=UPI001747C6A8|nr:uncharacterized protein LOC118645805 [Monomorium pharaonis]
MDRAKLVKLNTEALKKRAVRAGLSDQIKIPVDRDELIDMLLACEDAEAHLDPDEEESNPMQNIVEQSGASATSYNQSDNAPPVDTIKQLLATVTADFLNRQREMEEREQRFMERQQQQFERLAQMLMQQHNTSSARQALDLGPAAGPVYPTSIGNSPRNAQATPVTSIATVAPVKVSALVPQIPEFGGTEHENVKVWVRRVNAIAQIHAAPDGITLLAASSRFTKTAKKWYHRQEGEVLQSWTVLQQQLIKAFDNRVSMYGAMQKIEARIWRPNKETFVDYAMDKLELMSNLDLSVTDSINLIAGGITISSLKFTALSMMADSVEEFIEKMRPLTRGLHELERKPTQKTNSKPKDPDACRNCGRKGHSHMECRAETTCFYCKSKGHRQFDCPSKRRKNDTVPARSGTRPATTSRTSEASAAVKDEPMEAESVAAVREAAIQHEGRLEISGPLVGICKIENNYCNLSALVDTGSPVSFINGITYKKYLDANSNNLDPGG